MDILVVLLAGLVAGTVMMLLLARCRGGIVASGDVAVPLQHIAQSMKDVQGAVNLLGQRVTGLEQHTGTLQAGLQQMNTGLAQTGAMTSGVQQAAESIRREIGAAREGLASLQTRATAREELERQTAESVRRLETVIAGTASKGAAGENILELVFAQLPAEWRVTDFAVGNRRVEFGLRLPNNLVLPIDSKWPATTLLEEFVASDDSATRARLKKELESAVLAKAREVTKYLHPDLTASFGIAAVPDAAFELCSTIQVQAMQMNVVLIGYSMFVPYLLLVFQTVLSTSRDIDAEKLGAQLVSIERALSGLQGEIEGRLSRTVIQLSNSRDSLRGLVARADAGMTHVRAATTLELPGAMPVSQLAPVAMDTEDFIDRGFVSATPPLRQF